MSPRPTSRVAAGLRGIVAAAPSRQNRAARVCVRGLKTRVGGFCRRPSGRLRARRPQVADPASGCRACAYETASGRGFWPNRDPLEEEGGLNLYCQSFNAVVNLVDVLGRSSVAAPSPFDPCRDPCDDLKKSIIALARHVRGRYNDLLLDKDNLYGSRLYGNHSWHGHQVQFQGQQNRLRNAIEEYHRRGCGDPLPGHAYEEVARAVPSRPVRYELDPVDRLIANVTVSDKTLDGIRKGAIVTAAVGGVIASGGIAGPYFAGLFGGGLALAGAH
jgi:hypothetical protein